MIKNKNGFTLIEILVAITILSFLMVSVYSLVDNSTRTKDTILAEDKKYLQIHSALDRFALDWTQLYTPLFYAPAYNDYSSDQASGSSVDDDEGDSDTTIQDQNKSTQNPSQKVQIKFEPSERFPQITENEHLVPIIDDPNRGELIFMSTSGRRVFENSKQSRYVWIRYALRNSTAPEEEVDKDAPLELVRSSIKSNLYKKEFEWEKVPQYLLLRHIKSLEFLFWNRITKKYVSSLKELNDDKYTPRIMKIKMVINNDSNVEETIERSYRAIWPYFDVKAAQKEKKSGTKKINPGENQQDDPNEEN